MTSHDVLAALMSSLIGFAAGYGVGWMGKEAARIEDADGQLRGRWQTALGLFILAMVVATAVLSYTSATAQRHAAEDLQRFTACQTVQNKVFGENIAARAQATKAGNKAMRDFLLALANPAATPADKKRFFQNYLDALNEVDAIQAAHPLTVGTCP